MSRRRPFVLSALCAAGLCVAPLSAQDGVPSFSNQAAAAGVQFMHANPTFFTQADYTGGGAAGDFNRDGHMDIFAVSGGNTRDHLYINNGNGTFSDRALQWGLGVVHLGKGASVADYNDDGWPDIYVTSAGPVGAPAAGHHRLYRNNGNGTFTNVAAAAGVNFTHATQEGGFGAAFGDYDLDSDLDLFVAGFSNSHSNPHSQLFRNDGDGTFTNVTTAIDFWGGTSMSVKAFAPRFADTDGDRYPELLLVGDFGTSRYFRNNADGTFTDVTFAQGAGIDENGMGGTLGDYDNDGFFDWYVTSIYWPALNWTGNKLYWGTGSYQWNEGTAAAGCVDGGYGWGTVSVDLDHDGFVDIAETNGDNGTPMFVGEQSYLWINDGDGTFTESALALGLAHFNAGRGMLNLDYDGDGDQDLMIFSNFAQSTLWRNNLSGTEIAWLRVLLDTTPHDGLAPDGYGSIVRATVGGTTYSRHLYGGDNFQSSSELSAHFGLGAATLVDELRVEWSDGSVTVLNNVPVNQTLTLSPAADDHWTCIALGIGGSNGVPQLRGAGPLTAGNPATLTLTHGVPSSSAWLLISPAAALAPFKGGTLVPHPTVLLNLPTDGAGGFSPSAPWPGGLPSGVFLYFQVLQQDATGIAGWIVSNGLRATMP
jgi:hypothetical protein